MSTWMIYPATMHGVEVRTSDGRVCLTIDPERAAEDPLTMLRRLRDHGVPDRDILRALQYAWEADRDRPRLTWTVEKLRGRRNVVAVTARDAGVAAFVRPNEVKTDVAAVIEMLREECVPAEDILDAIVAAAEMGRNHEKNT